MGAVVVHHAAQPLAVDLAADEENDDDQPGDGERRVDLEGDADAVGAGSAAVTTSAVLRPRPIEPPAICAM